LERRRKAKKIKNKPATRHSSPMASQVALPVIKLPLIKPAPLTNPDATDKYG
jgi:hypothetical protein